MIKPIFTRNSILLFLALIFFGLQSIAKQNGDIILHDERLSVTPKEFYIVNVIDKRANRAAVAWLLPLKYNGQSKPYTVDLRGGGVGAVKQFIDHNVPRNTDLRPVVIGLKECRVTESVLADGRVEGHVTIVMSFELERREDEPLHLADYNGSAVYTRGTGQAQDIEPILRHVLESGLIYLNTWMNRQADTNIKLAKGVKVMFTDYAEKPEKDSIYYAVGRPITWNDFQSTMSSRRYDAEVFPGMGYNEHAEIIKGVVYVRLAIKVFLPKSACWVKENSRNDYTLNHEQRHFDIVKIVAEHFKQKILAQELPVSNFDGPINMEYLESYREMNNLQKQYDNETRHGTDRSMQQSWNERIDKELKAYGVK